MNLIPSGQAQQKPSVISAAAQNEYVSVYVENQLLCIAVSDVEDVLRGMKITPVPLAPKPVMGLLNLRGRTVVAIDVRTCLRLPAIAREDFHTYMSVIVKHKGELYSLMVDSVGEVIAFLPDQVERNPSNLSAHWKQISSGIYKKKDKLMVVVDVQKLLEIQAGN